MKENLNKMLAAWTFGDGEAMDDILRESLKKAPQLKTFYAKLYDERNVNMTAKIEEYLNTGATHFVIAGCHHIPGKMGILDILKNKKEKAYKIEQLDALGRPKVIKKSEKKDG